jgi:hypothetical protein
VALGSLVGPDRPRPFKVPFVRFEAILGAIARVFMMAGLGLLLYFG